MSHYFTGELGRMRTDEAIASADRYRLAQLVRRSNSHDDRGRLSWSKAFSYRRALAAVGLSALILVAFGAFAQARPIGPDPVGDGIPDITAPKHHPQVKGINLGQPNRSQHAFDRDSTQVANAHALELRADYYSRMLGRDPNAPALALRAEYYMQRLGSFPTDAIAQSRALNEPSSGPPIEAVAQLRAMNEPFSTTNVPGLEVADRPEQDFPFAQSIAIIAGILVLGAGALVVQGRKDQTPTTV